MQRSQHHVPFVVLVMSGHVLWVLIGVFAKSEHVQAGGGKKPAAASANASSWSTRPTARGKVVCIACVACIATLVPTGLTWKTPSARDRGGGGGKSAVASGTAIEGRRLSEPCEK